MLFLIAGNAFFVAAEFALVAVDRSRIERMADEGNRRARVVLNALHHLSFELSGAQLGITVSSLLLGFIAEPTIGEALQPLLDRVPGLNERSAVAVSVAVALALVTMVQMVLGELVPKNLAIARPVRTALWIGPLHRFTTILGSPVIRLLNGAANWTVRRFGIEPREELRSVRTLEELDLLIKRSGAEGTLDRTEHDLLTRMIRFGEKTAADALVPRTSTTALQAGDNVAQLVRTALETGFSRFPVYGEDLDDIVGVVHVKSATRVPFAARATTPVADLMTDGLVIPESRPLDELLRDMRAGRSQLAVVIDEYGGTAGILTMEDLLEEVVGEIRDEYDAAPGGARLTVPWQAGTYVLDGSLHRDEVDDLIGLELPEGDFETLAGYLLVLFDRIPAVGDQLEAAGWAFEVLEMERLRIALVRVTDRGGSSRVER